MDQREVARLVGGGEVPHGDGGLGGGVGGGRGVVVPGRARRLVAWGRCSRSPACASPRRSRWSSPGCARTGRSDLWCQRWAFGIFFDVPVLGVDLDPRAPGPGGRSTRPAPRARRPPRGSRATAVVGAAVEALLLLQQGFDGDRHDCLLGSRYTSMPASSRRSSMTSWRIMCRPSSTSLIMSRAPVWNQIRYSSTQRLLVDLPAGRGGVERLRGQGPAPQVEVVGDVLHLGAPVGEGVGLEHVGRDLRARRHDLVDDAGVALERLPGGGQPVVDGHLAHDGDDRRRGCCPGGSARRRSTGSTPRCPPASAGRPARRPRGRRPGRCAGG